MRNKIFFIFLFLVFFVSVSFAQKRLTQDEKLEKEIIKTGLIHSPLPLDNSNSFESIGLNKKVLRSEPIIGIHEPSKWIHSGLGTMMHSLEKTMSGKGSIKLEYPTFTGKRAQGSPSDPDYATYGNATVQFSAENANWEKYNRIVFYIYPDCDGARVVNMNLFIENGSSVKKPGYNRQSGTHLVNLINKQWNLCFLDIDEYQRDQIVKIGFSSDNRGNNRTTGDSTIYYQYNIL